MSTDNIELELKQAVERVLASASRKKLVVAEPGAGKTTLFRRLLQQADGNKDARLVLTFINNLKNDLDRSLGESSRVYTLHGYCQYLLYGSSFIPSFFEIKESARREFLSKRIGGAFFEA